MNDHCLNYEVYLNSAIFFNYIIIFKTSQDYGLDQTNRMVNGDLFQQPLVEVEHIKHYFSNDDVQQRLD